VRRGSKPLNSLKCSDFGKARSKGCEECLNDKKYLTVKVYPGSYTCLFSLVYLKATGEHFS